MAVIEAFRRRKKRFHAGLDTVGDIFWQYVDRIFDRLFHAKTKYYVTSLTAHRKKIFWHDEDRTYHIKDIRFPEVSEADEKLLLGPVFEDTLCSYYYFGDKYDEATVDYCDSILSEGIYGLVNDKVNVTVEPGDIVIDAGSWVGDFAAYASVKNATCYAFEPSESTFALLRKTAGLNGNIIPVQKGLSDENVVVSFFNAEAERTFSSTFSNELIDFRNGQQHFEEASQPVETVRLDDFVRENNLSRVDFIKSDIQGFERNMLEGAQETLARFAPKLALCTYHLPDDPEVMAGLIKKANPKYNIVQKRKKLYASVPQE